LALLEQSGPFAVVVSDMHMPGMDGVRFLAEVRGRSPDTVRMMLTGNATLQTSIDAVNDGQIFRFLVKPCLAEVFARALEAGLCQYRLITAEKDLLGKTLRGAVKLTTEVLALTNPTAFGRSSRVQRLVHQLSAALHVQQAWQCEIAAMLSQIGCIAVPEETLAKAFRNDALSDEEARLFRSHPSVGRDLIANIPRLEPIAQIIAHQDARFDGGPTRATPRGEDIPLGARILKAALDFDMLLTIRGSEKLALAEIRGRETWYDPAVVAALQAILDVEVGQTIKSVPLSELPQHAILADDVKTLAGRLLIARGQEVTPTLRARLQLHASTVGIHEPLKILVPIDVAPGAATAEPVLNHFQQAATTAAG
jgi:response regulator RpfG family c-di-GMP phosphodiesterase